MILRFFRFRARADQITLPALKFAFPDDFLLQEKSRTGKRLFCNVQPGMRCQKCRLS